MTARHVGTSAERLRRLVDDARNAPRDAVGDHLTDEEFVAYSMDPPEIEGDALPRVEQHLLSCAACSDRMEHLVAVSEAWRGPAGETRLAEVSQRIRDRFVATTPRVALVAASALSRLSEWLRQLPQCSAALGAVAGASLTEKSPAGSEHLSVREDEAGNLRVRISSYDVSLAGARVIIDPFDQPVTLARVAPDQVGAEALIPSAARRVLAPGTMVGWRVEEGDRTGGP